MKRPLPSLLTAVLVTVCLASPARACFDTYGFLQKQGLAYPKGLLALETSGEYVARDLGEPGGDAFSGAASVYYGLGERFSVQGSLASAEKSREEFRVDQWGVRGVCGLVRADGRVTLHEFLLFTVLRRRIGRDAHRAVPVRYSGLEPLASEVALVLSLLASARLPDQAERAYNAGILLLAGIEPPRVSTEAIELDAVSQALDRLNQLAPLAKPRLIKACSAVAFIDGQTNWKAASCLRTICAALDSPLPPQLLEAATAAPS